MGSAPVTEPKPNTESKPNTEPKPDADHREMKSGGGMPAASSGNASGGQARMPAEAHSGDTSAAFGEKPAIEKPSAGSAPEKPSPEQNHPVPVQGTFLSEQAKPLRRIIGQVFNTYWICEFDGKMYIFDQHAAHERVNFERFMKQYKERNIAAQQVSPPIIFQADAKQEMLLLQYKDSFAKIGFDIEPFGGRSFAVHSVPYTLGTIDSADLFRDFLSEIEVSDELADLDIFVHRVATEACKASVKGGEKLSFREAEALLDELMRCDDPYHCPHGRPTIIAFTKKDLEKRFKRIV